MNKNIIKTALASWCVLGGYRNVHSSNYNRNKIKIKLEKELLEFENTNSKYRNQVFYEQRVDELKKRIKEDGPRELFIDKSLNFVGGIILYGNPVFLPMNIEHELYRLEVNIRGLEEEKQSDRYNKIWFH